MAFAFLSTMTSDLLPLTALLLLCALLSRWYKRRAQRRSLPPGPPGLPLIGNVMDIPTEQGWFVYASMAQKYGTSTLLCVFRIYPDFFSRRGYYVHGSHGAAPRYSELSPSRRGAFRQTVVQLLGPPMFVPLSLPHSFHVSLTL